MTTILIADDHWAIVEGIRTALQNHPDFMVVGHACDGKEAIELAAQLRPEIVIMDVSMPKLNGIEATQQIVNADDSVRILAYTMYSNKDFIIDLFRAGISGLVLKEDPVSDLLMALKVVSTGGTYMSERAPAVLREHIETLERNKTAINVDEELTKLSSREHEVFLMLAEGKSLKDIAEQLYISKKTVESHKYNLMAKLEAKTTTDLTRIAIRKKMIAP